MGKYGPLKFMKAIRAAPELIGRKDRPTLLLVGDALVLHADNKTGERCHPTMETLAAETGFERHVVSRAIHTWAQWRFVKIGRFNARQYNYALYPERHGTSDTISGAEHGTSDTMSEDPESASFSGQHGVSDTISGDNGPKVSKHGISDTIDMVSQVPQNILKEHTDTTTKCNSKSSLPPPPYPPPPSTTPSIESAAAPSRLVVQEVLKILSKLPYWSVKGKRDEEWLKDVMEEYPGLDYAENARAMVGWVLDQPPKKRWNHRARYRNFLKNDQKRREQAAAVVRGEDEQGTWLKDW